MWPLSKSNTKASSRTQLDLKEVRDGILVLPKNEYRLVIETSAINFELKSEAEQDVIIDGFQSFLNSLPNQIQILVRVREVDLDQYLETLSQSTNGEKTKIYQEQIKNYCQFIKNLVAGNKILSRHFYLVISYHQAGGKADFELAKAQLHLTKDLVIKGLEKLGMKAKSLDSLGYLDLFYRFYNPSQIKTQELKHQTLQALVEQNYV